MGWRRLLKTGDPPLGGMPVLPRQAVPTMSYQVQEERNCGCCLEHRDLLPLAVAAPPGAGPLCRVGLRSEIARISKGDWSPMYHLIPPHWSLQGWLSKSSSRNCWIWRCWSCWSWGWLWPQGCCSHPSFHESAAASGHSHCSGQPQLC